MITDLCEVIAVIDKVGGVHPVSRPLNMGLLVVDQRQYIIISQFHHEIASTLHNSMNKEHGLHNPIAIVIG